MAEPVLTLMRKQAANNLRSILAGRMRGHVERKTGKFASGDGSHKMQLKQYS